MPIFLTMNVYAVFSHCTYCMFLYCKYMSYETEFHGDPKVKVFEIHLQIAQLKALHIHSNYEGIILIAPGKEFMKHLQVKAMHVPSTTSMCGTTIWKNGKEPITMAQYTKYLVQSPSNLIDFM